MNCKISIITPVFQPDEEKISRLIRSLHAQTNKNFEWIIVHDAYDFVPFSHSLTKDLKTKEACLGENYGPGTARNCGFNISDGDIIAYADADDELSKDRVQHLIDLYTRYPDNELVFDAYKISDGYSMQTYCLMNMLMSHWEDLPLILQKQNVSIPLGVSHTRKAFMLGGMFQRGIVCGEDGLLWRRISERIDHAHIMMTDSIAGTYYVNPAGQSRTQRRFEMGGFAFDAGNVLGSHGQYLDKDYFNTFNSVDRFDK